MKKNLRFLCSLCCFLLIAFAFSGCAIKQAVEKGYIWSMTTRQAGIFVEATTESTQTPRVVMEVQSTTINYIPVIKCTNADGTVTCYTPAFATAGTSKQIAWNPLSMDTAETTFAGPVQVGTNATGQAIVPKLGPPAAPTAPRAPPATPLPVPVPYFENMTITNVPCAK